MNHIDLAIHGATGRMGQRLVTLAHAAPGLRVAAAIADQTTTLDDGTPVTSGFEQLGEIDVLIDFSVPAASVDAALAAADAGAAVMVGTTGLSDEQRDEIFALADRVPVMIAANTSLGVNVLLGLVRRAVASLPDWDVEVSEIHHRHKVDAPSGTALALARASQAARADLSLRSGRDGHAPRATDELGIAAIRGGDVAGEHTVYLFGEQERIELTHRATDRDIFVRGALTAARWLAGKPAGRYGMHDVLFSGDSHE